MVWDSTRRFKQRPHYDPSELDAECEVIITEFMRSRYGKLLLPIPTDALTVLIERDTADLDLYADLSNEGENVQGLTCFYPGKKPTVSVAKELQNQRYVNRLRTTLTHEYGHVRFHDPLYQVEESPSLFESSGDKEIKCKWDDILDTKRDWMEWQAGYVCGSLLMPITHLRKLASEFLETRKLVGPLKIDLAASRDLRSEVAQAFEVSEEAAQVRLLKLKYLSDPAAGPSLF